MSDEELRSKLEHIHDQIENIDEVDDQGRAILRDLDGHIRELLARSEGHAAAPRRAMTRGLEDAIRHFEVTHPTLTAALSDLLTAQQRGHLSRSWPPGALGGSSSSAHASTVSAAAPVASKRGGSA